MVRSLLFASCLGACMMVGTATWAQRSDTTVSGALTQPLRDLSILRPEPAEALQRAAAGPYAAAATLPNGGLDCASIAREIESLDAVLGDDVDVARAEASLMAQARTGAGDALVDAVGDLVSLPYRGLIRRITGAERRDREAREAEQAGIVRRAFLKGLSARECATPPLLAVIEATPEVTLAAAEPEVVLTDLELAHRQLAAANAARDAAAAEASVSPAASETEPDAAVLPSVADPLPQDADS